MIFARLTYNAHAFILKNLVNAIRYIIIFLSLFIPCSHAQKAYVSGTVGNNYCNMQNSHGGTILSKAPLLQIGFFVGYIYSHTLGVEIGFWQTVNKFKSVYVAPQTAEFGIINFSTISSSTYETKKIFKGVNILYSPQISLHSKVILTPQIGITYMDARAYLQLEEFDGASATAEEQEEYYLKFAKQKCLPTLGAKVNYLFSKKLSIQASVLWMQSSKLVMYASRAIFTGNTLAAKCQNSTSVNIGLVYYIVS